MEMGLGRLAIGQTIKWNNEIFTLSGRAAKNKWRLQSVQFLDIQEVEEDVLIEAIGNREIRFSESGNATIQTENGFFEYDFPGILQLPEKTQKEIHFRFFVIKPLIPFIESGKGLSKEVDKRETELKNTGEELLGHAPPSRATIYRWIAYYRDSQCDWRALKPNHEKSHNTHFSQQVEDIIDDVIEGLGGEQVTNETLHAQVESRIFEINRSEGLELDIPSESTVYRRLKSKDPFDIEKQRYGEEVAYNNHGNKKMGITGEAPLARVEVDHTPVDLLLVDKNGDEIGKKWLTTIMDSNTRTILGHHLSYSPSATSILYALKNAIRSKSYIKSKYPHIELESNIYGVPKVIVTDRGRDFTSKHFDNTCRVIGIEIDQCPPHMPRFKGKIERFYGSISKGLFHQLIGTTLSNVVEKKKINYKSEKKAGLTEEELDDLVHLWIYGVYHKKKHRGALGVPNDLWDTRTKGIPKTFPSNPDWELLVGKTGDGTIQPEGIRYQYLDYNSDELHLLRRGLIAQSMPLKIMFVYDTDNIGHIRIFDPINKRHIKVPCTDSDYAEGLSEYLHGKVIESMNQKDRLNRAARSRALKLIMDKTKAASITSRKARREMKRMKFKNGMTKATKKTKGFQTNEEVQIDHVSEPKPQISLVPPRKPKVYTNSDWEGSTYARKIF
ncbi:DDE-type integrase/transposase/recombinase [Paenibacillus sp. Soil724D2]|uniref:DDE-type integrase/transposase/recombinase n=1 Tax=Paenibacillus sp. (strain Soil724D2) TaxID=1736392 RepID=UPI000712A8CD|nr:DDE-type integrase/transposase/recombinase [Paenibacillus sp. Soil724D2]KRE48396.1 hypothetical protein ASG85_05175 [Paenibacillus sp. Soil724D2]